MTVGREGWAFPGDSNRAHFFGPDRRSLCSRWGLYTGPLSTDREVKDEHKCSTCRRKRDAQLRAAQAPERS